MRDIYLLCVVPIYMILHNNAEYLYKHTHTLNPVPTIKPAEESQMGVRSLLGKLTPFWLSEDDHDP